jgi:putative intracellular protease/amidase
VTDVWASLTTAEDSVVAVSGVANAWYFARRAQRSEEGARARRFASGLLAVLCGGAAVLALALLAGGHAEGWPGAIARVPLVVGSATTFALVVAGRRR